MQILVEMDVPRADPDFAAAGHRVAGVHDEVHDDLLELAFIHTDGREIGPVFDPERHLVGQETVQQMCQLAQRVLEVDDRGSQRLFAREGQKLSHERRRPVGVLTDLHQVAVFHVRHVVPHQQKVAMAVDRRQQVVEVMRHAAGELADGLHFLGLDELRLERLELGRVGENRQNRGGSVEDRAGEGHLEKNLLAFGLAARAIGNGMKVGIVQYVKGKWETGERVVLERFPDQVTIRTMGEGFTWETQDKARDIAAAERAWAASKEMIADPSYDLIVLDELNIVLRYDYLDLAEVLATLAARRPMLHVVVTGRNAKPELIEAADLVTEMTQVKHPFREQNVRAQKGIEF